MNPINKKIAIAEQISLTADQMTERAKTIHSIRKKPRFARKKPFSLKKYKAQFPLMAFDALHGAAKIAQIASQPIPKFKEGGLNVGIICNSPSEEHFMRLMLKDPI